jgi:hypothetical protein
MTKGWLHTALAMLAAPMVLAQPVWGQSRGTGVRPVAATIPNRTAAVPLDALPERTRDAVSRIIQKPTIVARAEPEEFSEGIYCWLVDNPDRASLAWRRLGIPCAAIAQRPDGRYGWTDGQGTEVTWHTAFKNDDMHVWLADGQAKLGPMTPTIAVRAVAVLHHRRTADRYGRPMIKQHAEIYLQTDSKAATIVARILGPAIPHLADTGASQLLLFFSGLTRYFENHPEDIRALLAPAS